MLYYACMCAGEQAWLPGLFAGLLTSVLACMHLLAWLLNCLLALHRLIEGRLSLCWCSVLLDLVWLSLLVCFFLFRSRKNKYALRVLPAVTRLTVYRGLRVETSWRFRGVKIEVLRNLWKGLTPYSFFDLKYVISIWNYTTKAQIYSFWLGESALHHWGFEAKILRKNRKQMTDVKSIHNHSRKVPGAPGHQNTL